MRAVPSETLARGRERRGFYRSTDADGCQGRFLLCCPATSRHLLIVASTGQDWAEAGLPGDPWEHVSVSVLKQPGKTPSWPEMVWVKDLFWGPEETVMQLHVPMVDHINYHAGCLHLWKPIGVEIPRPPAATVAPPESA